MKLDKKNNIINVCLFENYLAKYFVEHPEIFKPLWDRILKRIEALIAVNDKNQLFDRVLFNIFSFLYSIDLTDDFEALKKSESLIIMNHFLKRFTEIAMIVDNLCLPPAEGEQADLKQTYQPVFFKNAPSKDLLVAKTRPASLFDSKERGVIELDSDSETERENSVFGILDEKYISPQLANYFKFLNAPSRLIFAPNESSNTAVWLRKHYLPVICGASGGIGYVVSNLSTFIDFNSEECQLLGIMMAASSIAIGHHSFFEVMLPISFVTTALEEKETLLAFYEQTIPEFIKKLPSYKEHLSSEQGSALIEEFNFDKKPIIPLIPRPSRAERSVSPSTRPRR